MGQTGRQKGASRSPRQTLRFVVPATYQFVGDRAAVEPDNVSIPVPFRETLAVLNYSDPHERSLAEAYRNAEVPFKIYDVPDVEYARDAWTDVYLTEQFDRKGNQFKVEESENNHFM